MAREIFNFIFELFWDLTLTFLVANGDEQIKPRVSERSERNPRTGRKRFRSLKGSNLRECLTPFRSDWCLRRYLGFHSLRSFHPRLHRFVAFGDRDRHRIGDNDTPWRLISK